MKIYFKIIYLIYIVSIGFFLVKRDIASTGISVFALIGVLLIIGANKIYNKLFHNSLTVVLVLFITMSLVFGTCFNFYSINHYDDFLHIWSGLIGCSIAYSMFVFFIGIELDNKKKRFFFALYLFMFSMGIASIWELVEFGMDKFLPFNCKPGGL